MIFGNVRKKHLAASVPLFAATKAEKAFGFRVNQVYLRWACARNSGPFILPINKDGPALQQSFVL
jgi:hypothetical protein